MEESLTDFRCPITGDIMIDPVIGSDGNNYERVAITEWLTRKQISPLTREPMLNSNLNSNRLLKQQIERYIEKLRKEGNDDPFAHIKNESDNGIVDSIYNFVSDNLLSTTSVNGDTSVDTDTSLVINTFQLDADTYAHIKIVPPKGTIRTPVNIILVIDVSGSMSTEAEIKTISSGIERNGLSLLDCVKHSTKTIIKTLNENDTLTLVKFSDNARVVMQPTRMNESGKIKAISCTNELRTEGYTNLYDGIIKGLEQSRYMDNININAVWCLTDGVPSTHLHPFNGIFLALKQFLSTNTYNGTISMFNFGYNLDSKLSDSIATLGNGLSNFIPDASFIGTTFCNALGNVLSTYAFNTNLNIETLNGITLNEPNQILMGNIDFQKIGNKITISPGNLLYEQSRDIIVKLNIPSNLPPNSELITATYNYTNINGQITSCNGTCLEITTNKELVFEGISQLARLKTVDTIISCNTIMCNNKIEIANKILQENIKYINYLKSLISGSICNAEIRISALLEDLNGQILESIRYDYFKKWGAHYLLSLYKSHQLQQCINFKDPGIQYYGGEISKKYRDEADQIFSKLPPPTQSAKSSQTTSVVQSMASYNNCRNPCCHGKSEVQMADGSIKLAKDIQKGDRVSTGSGTAIIKCVIQTKCEGNEYELVGLNSSSNISLFWVHPYHPVRVIGSSKWTLPHLINNNVQLIRCEFLYSFILDFDIISNDKLKHNLIISGYEFITWGHESTDPIAKHQFFGTSYVIDAIKEIAEDEYEEGRVIFEPGCLNKKIVNGKLLAIGFDKDKLITNTLNDKLNTNTLNTNTLNTTLQLTVNYSYSSL